MAPNPKALYIWFIDVGMGDATFVKFADGTTMLIDFGSTKGEQIREDLLSFFPTLEKEGFITNDPFEIEFLFITHPDQDHYNLLKFLIEKGYSFGNIFFTGEPTDYKSKGPVKDASGGNWNSFKDWLKEQIKNKKASQLNCPNGQKIWKETKDAKIHLLAANVANESKHTTLANNRSIVLMIEYKNTKILLAADATYVTEKNILDSINSTTGKLNGLDIGDAILKLGHHGSARTSTSKEWVEKVKPRCLFVSSERTGEQKGEGGKATGHRLPQQAAIDTIRQFAPSSLQKTKGYLAIGGDGGDEHSYVAYHDDEKKTTTNCFGKSRSIDNFLVKDEKTTANNLQEKTIKSGDVNKVSNFYYEVKTDLQIFTTICKLDYEKVETKGAKRSKVIADLGTTYGLEIKSDGTYMIYPWLEEFEKFDNWEPTDTYYHLGKET